MNEYDFQEKLAFSRARAKATDEATILALIPGCVAVSEAPLELDKRGIDYVATLRRDATLNIDLKAREPGCAVYWKTLPLFSGYEPEPELSLELWSVCPEDGNPGIVGWTLDEGKLTDYTLHVFDPSDTTEVFLLPFQLLRMAFRRRLGDWMNVFRCSMQNSGAWRSQCLFVPACTVIDAIQAEMRPKTLE